MKIFLISRGIPDRHNPLWGNFELDQAEALRRLGHQVTILAIDGRLGTATQKGGITYHPDFGAYVYRSLPWGVFKFSERLHQGFKKWMMRRLFRKVVKKEGQPDVVYVHYLLNIADSRRIREIYDGPMIGIEHWSELLRPEMQPHVDRMAKNSYGIYDKILTVSPSLNKVIKEKYGIESEVVPNMISEDFVNTRRVKKESTKFTFLAIGRLIALKNFDLLIKAAAQLKARGKDFEVLIIGEGEEREKLSTLIKESEVDDRVKMLGLLDRKEIIKRMEHGDCMVLPSSFETFGLVLIEGMAAGLPAIATKAGGPEFIVNETNGILVNPEDVDALAEAMAEMIDHSDRFDSEKIASETIKKYSPANIAKRLTSIFEEEIAKKKN